MDSQELQDFEYFKTNIKLMVYHTMRYAADSHELIFSDEKERNEQLAATFVSIAISYCNTSQVYYLTYPDGAHQEFDDFFTSFDTYASEILTNIRTQHSHQWTDIEYREFVKSAKLLAGLLSMDVEHLYQDLD